MEKAHVTAGKPKITGAVFVAPLGTALPTNSATALTDAYKELGYISEDGLTNSLNSNGVKAWGGDVVLPNNADQFKMKLIEVLNAEVAKFVFGAENVSGELETGISLTVNDSERDIVVMVIDMVLRSGKAKRVVIPRAQVETVGDIVYKDNDVVGYDVTVGCRMDASGNYHYEYTNVPAPSNG